MADLWRDHPATPNQRSLFEKVTGRRRAKPTQADLPIAMLRERRAQRRPLELPDIMNAGIAQHRARLNELRGRGFVILNELERFNGAVHSCHRLTFDPEREAQ